MVQSKQFYFKREEWVGGGGSKQKLTKTKPTSKANTKSLSSTSSIWVLMESTPNDSVIPPHQLCCLYYNTISYIGSTSLVPVRCLSRYPVVSASPVSWGSSLKLGCLPSHHGLSGPPCRDCSTGTHCLAFDALQNHGTMNSSNLVFMPEKVGP